MSEFLFTLTRSDIFAQLAIPDGKLDITDPCYDADVWCRMTVDVVPGNYNCYAYRGEDPEWGNRVWLLQIALCKESDWDVTHNDNINFDELEEIGEIGVDAGLAGFFNHKPDYDSSTWSRMCDGMFGNGNELVEVTEDDSVYTTPADYRDGTVSGFWSSSGCGDGCYPVYAHKNKAGQIDLVEIHFTANDLVFK